MEKQIDGSSDDEKNVTLGSIIAAVQVTGMASLIVIQKPILKKYESTVATLIYYGVGTVLTMIVVSAVAFTFEAKELYFDSNYLPWVAVAYAASFGTFFPYNVYSWTGKFIKPSIITVYSTVQPVGTAIISLIALKAVVTLPEIGGAVLVIVGLILTVYGQSLETKTKKSLEDER